MTGKSQSYSGKEKMNNDANTFLDVVESEVDCFKKKQFESISRVWLVICGIVWVFVIGFLFRIEIVLL